MFRQYRRDHRSETSEPRVCRDHDRHADACSTENTVRNGHIRSHSCWREQVAINVVACNGHWRRRSTGVPRNCVPQFTVLINFENIGTSLMNDSTPSFAVTPPRHAVQQPGGNASPPFPRCAARAVLQDHILCPRILLLLG